MKKIYTILFVAAAFFASCEEFQPVFTGKYPESQPQIPVVLEKNMSILDLKDLYASCGNKPVTLTADIVISGKVTTSDQVGNLYKSLYIQDETAGIEVKIGRNGLYNEYKLGQTIYVNCTGLTLGDYNGMVNLGYSDYNSHSLEESGVQPEIYPGIGYCLPYKDYETSYLEHPYIIDQHVFKGEYGDPVEPVVIRESDLHKKENLGRLVTIENLKYANEIFLLFYHNPNLSGEAKKAPTNRFFASTDYDESPKTYGVTTWALSELLFKELLYKGNFDGVDRQDGQKYTRDYIERDSDGNVLKCDILTDAYAVSQYFKMGSTEVQVRTSGYARFADTLIPEEVRAGSATVTFTGILTEYDGEAQFTLIDLDGVKKSDGTPWYN